MDDCPKDIPVIPYGRFHWLFDYKPEDHDDREKTFLGYTGTSMAKTSWTLLRINRLRPGSWLVTSTDSSSPTSPMSPVGTLHHQLTPEAIEFLADAYNESRGDIRSILRALFNSEFFKNARFARVKSPAELIVGTVRMAATIKASSQD